MMRIFRKCEQEQPDDRELAGLTQRSLSATGSMVPGTILRTLLLYFY